MRLYSHPLIFLLLMTVMALACNFTSDNASQSPTAVSTLVSFATGSPAASTSSPTATLSATATRLSPTSAASSGSTSSIYVVDLPAPAPAYSVSPTGDFDVNIRSSNSLTAPIVGYIEEAAWVKVDYHNEGWFRIDYPGTPVDNLWISDDPVTLVQPCHCTPDCVAGSNDYIAYDGPQSDCRVDYTRPDPMNLYSQPTENSTIVGTLGQGQFSFAFAHRDMWYKIYIPETDSYGWVPMGVLDMWTGAPCTTLPVEAMPATDECIVVNISGENAALYSSPNDSAFVLRFPAGMSAVGLEQQGEWIKVHLEQGKWPDSGDYWIKADGFSTEGPCDF